MRSFSAWVSAFDDLGADFEGRRLSNSAAEPVQERRGFMKASTAGASGMGAAPGSSASITCSAVSPTAGAAATAQ